MMGAMPFEYLANWYNNPNDALASLQSLFLGQNYDLPSLIQEHIRSVTLAIHDCKETGDEFGLLDSYETELRNLESIAATPIPEAVPDQINLLRKINELSGQGLGNILDIRGVDQVGGIHVARQLPAPEIHEYFGTDVPTVDEAKKLLVKIASNLGRGESVCCPVYEEGSPIGWWFAGYTID